MERKTKFSFQLDTPFTKVEWPSISDKDQKHILDLLYNLLTPIGQNRPTASRGKRSKKRKRQEVKAKSHEAPDPELQGNPKPPQPEIQKHIIVGLQSILRQLQSSARKDSSRFSEDDTPTDQEIPPSMLHFAAIFAFPALANSPTILTTHLPALTHTASLAKPSLPPTQLIFISKQQADKLRVALGIARVSHIGILSTAPGTETLLAVIREAVPEIVVPWMNEEKGREYLSTKVGISETTVGPPKKGVKVKEKGDDVLIR